MPPLEISEYFFVTFDFMKNLFKGYYKLGPQEIRKIWKNGFISLDTNVLLGLYRYSEETRSELIKEIEKHTNKLWLPYHVAYEFHKNRINVIDEQIKVYAQYLSSINKLEDDLKKNSKPPHLAIANQKRFISVLNLTKKDLLKTQSFFMRLLESDTILKTITRIFNGRVGLKPSKEDIQKLEREGEDRYKRRVPPGYKDEKKEINKYGDFIFWEELIKRSIEVKSPFILITDDVKEDWLLAAQGKTLSPRPELLQELQDRASQKFYMYTSDRFLAYSSVGNAKKKNAIKEVREVQKEIAAPPNSYMTSNNFITPTRFTGSYDYSDRYKFYPDSKIGLITGFPSSNNEYLSDSFYNQQGLEKILFENQGKPYVTSESINASHFIVPSGRALDIQQFPPKVNTVENIVRGSTETITTEKQIQKAPNKKLRKKSAKKSGL